MAESILDCRCTRSKLPLIVRHEHRSINEKNA
jgi:hypothetical protein